MTECKFKVGEKYKARNGVILTFLAIGKTRVFFEDFIGDAHTRQFDGRVHSRGTSEWDVLPEPIREPRKAEGFVWVNEYADNPTDGVFGSLFNLAISYFDDKESAEVMAAKSCTRVAVKYKVTFEEVVE